MKIAIVIPCFGQCSLLQDLIEILKRQYVDDLDTLVIYLVDNGSAECLEQHAEYACIVKPVSNLFYFGAAYYVCQIKPDLDTLVMLNQDVAIRDLFFVDKLVKPLKYLPQSMAAVAPTVVLCKFPARINAYGLRKCLAGIWLPDRFLERKQDKGFPVHMQVQGISGCAFAVRKGIFDSYMSENIGLDIFYNEDSSLNEFFHRRRLSVIINSGCIVEHDYTPVLFSVRRSRMWVLSYIRKQIRNLDLRGSEVLQNGRNQAVIEIICGVFRSICFMLGYLMRIIIYKSMLAKTGSFKEN